MNPPHPESGLPRHNLVHLHLDPHHHHHVHIHLCHHHPVAPAPAAHHHHHAHEHPAPVFIPGAAPWQPEPPRSAIEEPAENQDADRALHAEEDDEEPVFVLTDEWAEFFAKSDAKRRLAKQQNKDRK